MSCASIIYKIYKSDIAISNYRSDFTPQLLNLCSIYLEINHSHLHVGHPTIPATCFSVKILSAKRVEWGSHFAKNAEKNLKHHKNALPLPIIPTNLANFYLLRMRKSKNILAK